MKLVMTLLVRDEEDILETNLRYHLEQGIDYVIATDNRSTDGTTEILKEHERAGHLRYVYEGDDDYSQAHWVTRMARLAATEHGADWVINNDADEFWWPKAGDLTQALAEVPSDVGTVRARRVNFVPRPGTGPPFARMKVREVRSLNPNGRPLPPKACHRADAEVDVAQGNHRADGPRLGRVWARRPIVIFHYPMRTYEQFENKIVLGGRAYERNADLPEKVGSTWRRLYERYQAGELPDHWAAQEVSDDAAAAGIAAGSMISDVRLLRFLERHGIPLGADRA